MKRFISRTVSAFALLCVTALPAFAGPAVTCPGTVYDDLFGAEWTLQSVKVVSGTSISIFGVTLYEDDPTLAGTYKSSSGATRTVDCSEIRVG